MTYRCLIHTRGCTYVDMIRKREVFLIKNNRILEEKNKELEKNIKSSRLTSRSKIEHQRVLIKELMKQVRELKFELKKYFVRGIAEDVIMSGSLIQLL